MRVLHVSQPTEAGVPAVILGLVREQLSRGWDVGVACPLEGTLATSARAEGAEIFAWPARRNPLRGVPSEYVCLGKILGSFAPDVVHLHSAKAGLVGRMILRGRIPTVFQPHAWSFHAAGRLSAAARLWERIAASWVALIIAVSNDEWREGIAARIQAPYLVAPNGVVTSDYGTIDRRSARRALGVDSGPVVVCVGRLAVQKGQDLLLRAWPSVVSEHPSARLYLVGDGELRSRLESIGMAGVIFVGASGQVPLWLSAADVVALPSRWEAGSLVLLEAMASGASVVASRFEGAADALAEGCGALVPVADSRSLAREISRRLSDPELRECEGDAAARLVRARFESSALVPVVGDAYKGLLQE